jgi:hypothetical protein
MNSRSNRLIKVLLISLHVLSASSVPLIMSDALIIQPSLLNTTTNVTIPPPSPADPRMTIRASYRLDVLLDPKSVLAIVTNEMAKLAIMDYNGRLGSFQSTPWAGYSDTKIQFKVSAAAQRVETRIAVWSLHYLAANMGILNRYCHVQFRILWDNVQVATLRISPARSSQATIERRGGQQRNNIEDLPFLQDPGASFGGSNGVNGTSLTYGELIVGCLYNEDAVDLSVTEVLGAVMAGLRNVAPMSKTDRMDGIFKTNTEGIDSEVCFAGNDVTPDEPRYQYQFVVSTLRTMPQWLLGEGRLAEIHCGLIIYGRYVGISLLNKLRPD